MRCQFQMISHSEKIKTTNPGSGTFPSNKNVFKKRHVERQKLLEKIIARGIAQGIKIIKLPFKFGSPDIDGLVAKRIRPSIGAFIMQGEKAYDDFRPFTITKETDDG
jgi:hypothetical protein